MELAVGYSGGVGNVWNVCGVGCRTDRVAEGYTNP